MLSNCIWKSMCCHCLEASHSCHTSDLNRLARTGLWRPLESINHKLLPQWCRRSSQKRLWRTLTRLSWQIEQEQTEVFWFLSSWEADDVPYCTLHAEKSWRRNVVKSFSTRYCAWNNLLALNTSPMVQFCRQKVTRLDGSGTAVLKVS